MHFEEDDTRATDEDPEFTGAAGAADDADDEFLSDDVPLGDDDADPDEEDEEDEGLTADL